MAVDLRVLGDVPVVHQVLGGQRVSVGERQYGHRLVGARHVVHGAGIEIVQHARGCETEVEQLMPYLTGVDLVPLVPQLETFPDKRAGAWSIRLRRPLLELAEVDAQLLRGALATVSGEPADVIPGYLANIRPVSAQTER